LAGDVTGSATGALVVGLRNIEIGTLVPTIGQVLTFDGIRWVPRDLPAGGATGVSGVPWDSGATTWDNDTVTWSA
jgi:hypothetical protein